MGGTVGGVFVLCGLVPLVGGDSVVHEPETRSVGPEIRSQNPRRPEDLSPKGGREGSPKDPPHLLPS